MKKLLKFSLVLAVVLTTTMTFASDADFMLYTKGEGKTVRLTFNGIKNINLSIFDDNHDLVFRETLTGDLGVKRTYGFDQLPEGTYFLEAETAAKVATYEITVKGSAVEMSKKPISEVYKPTLKNNGGVVTMNIVNAKKSTIDLKIYDADNNEVYNGTLAGTETVSKKFDLNKIATAEYTFVTSYDNKIFTQTIASK